ncbi:hypothetical protein [Amycolatopsis alkalitolerans]|uniref:Uncharacterized protein n=1 Tax=Amycolatopsis alkalitolerans TaxID=2547244 RepID=A0A5C4M9E2_9PSEU|nr:hypothetical protein [Amycolatopsis alkalitolerans]TNC28767.1 hypothetical protein FG385_05850 [Amycolatopsis alkalitolerans]
MPSHTHEALTLLFRNQPSLAAELLSSSFDLPVPDYESARVESGDLTDLSPTEYRADAVVVLSSSEAAELAVVVEVQLRRDRGKCWSWPVYLATLRARLRCPAVLLVVCVDEVTAAWCATPLELGHPGWVLAPLVLGPDRVPVVTDTDLAASCPELVVLSAASHGMHPQREQIFQALITALKSADEQQSLLYHDFVVAALPEAARKHLEALMATGTYEYQSEFARRYFYQGEAEGEVKAVLAVLESRGIEVSESARERIHGCTDLAELDGWIRRVATVRSVDELFE